jgi:hypothetical protein
MRHYFALFFLMIFFSANISAQKFKALAIAENGGHHVAYSARAKEWLNQLAKDSNFAIDYIETPKHLNDSILNQYQLFIQLDYPPYGWGDTAEKHSLNILKKAKVAGSGFIMRPY